MVHDLLFNELLLGMLLWLGVHTYLRWRCSPATKRPPAQQPQKSPKTLAAFGGLPQRPYCAACEQGQEHGDPPPLSPPPVLTSKRSSPLVPVKKSGSGRGTSPGLGFRFWGWDIHCLFV